jgi:general secretion pathway protein M
MNQFDAFNQWYTSLQPRERLMVIATSIVVAVTIFYIAIWEPLHKGLDDAQQQFQSNLKNLQWMQQAATEVRSLKASGGRIRNIDTNQPVTLLVEQSAAISAIKPNLSKLESSGQDGARVALDGASFDQMLIWLNNLEQNHGVPVSSANIERADKPGTINARLSFNRAE